MTINVDTLTPQEREALLIQLQAFCPDCKTRRKRANEVTCLPCALAEESGVEATLVARVVAAAQRLKKVTQVGEADEDQHQTVDSTADKSLSLQSPTPLKSGKWHVNAYGEVVPCRSLNASCTAKYGHFSTKDDAWRWWKEFEAQGGKPSAFYRWHITKNRRVTKCGNSWTCTYTRKELHFKTEKAALEALQDNLPSLLPFLDFKA